MRVTTNNKSDLFLITEATGNVGPIYCRSTPRQRNPRTGSFPKTLPKEMEVVECDLTKPVTLIPALKDITGLHLINIGGDDFEPLQLAPEITELAKRPPTHK